MNTRKAGLSLMAAGIVLTAGWSLLAAPRGERQSRGEEVTLTGRLVDLQSFMTGRFPGGDPKKSSQQALRSGVPAALETDEGLIVIGMGERGPARLLSPLALQHVELRGKLFEKEGLAYLDLISAKAAKAEGSEEEGEHVEHADPVDEHQEEPIEEEVFEEETPEEEP